MTQHARSRPWYCNDRLVDDWRAVERNGGDLKVLKSLKIARSIIVNLGIIGITLTALYLGGDVTVLGSLGLFVLGSYNGIEVLDYLSLAQAIVEVKQDGQAQQEQGNDSEDA